MFELTILAIHTCDFRFHTCDFTDCTYVLAILIQTILAIYVLNLNHTCDLHVWRHHTCDFTYCTYVLVILIQTIRVIYMFGHTILVNLGYILAIYILDQIILVILLTVLAYL